LARRDVNVMERLRIDLLEPTEVPVILAMTLG